MEATTVKAHSPKNVRFEMRLTPEEARQINMLSQQEGKPAEKVITMLVRQSLRKIRSETLSPVEIMKLPPEERTAIISKQFQDAEKLYRDNSDMIVPDVDPPMTY